MIVNSLTNHVYTPWGVRYNEFKWRNEWYTFLKLYDKELKETNSFRKNTTNSVSHIICWFDRNIIQRIGIDNKVTIQVRIRIICGMINKLFIPTVTREMKIEFMECIWDTYKQMDKSWSDYYCLNILGLPF